VEYSGVQVRKINCLVNVKDDKWYIVEFLKRFCNLYNCYICIQGEAWTGTE